MPTETNSTVKNTDTTMKETLNQGVKSESQITGSDSGKINEQEDGPVENKFNDYTAYWDPLEEKFVMSTDTPTVRIYISREIVPDTVEGEEDTQELDEALATVEASHDMSVVYQNKDINNNNTTVVNLNDEQILAMNAIDKLDLKNVPK